MELYPISYNNLQWKRVRKNMYMYIYACACQVSVQRFSTLWFIAHQAPLFMGFSRQEYWSGLPSLPPEDLPNPGIKPISLMSPTLAGSFFTTRATWETHTYINTSEIL